MPIGPTPTGNLIARKSNSVVANSMLAANTGTIYGLTNDVGTIYNFSVSICHNGIPTSYTGTVSYDPDFTGPPGTPITIPTSGFILRDSTLVSVSGILDNVQVGIGPTSITATEYAPYIGDTLNVYQVTGVTFNLFSGYSLNSFSWYIGLDYQISTYDSPYVVPSFSNVTVIQSRIQNYFTYTSVSGCVAPEIPVTPETSGTFFETGIFPVYSESNNNTLLKVRTSCPDTQCPPGQLAQSVPLIPGSFQNDAGLPLIENAAVLINKFPSWFNKNKCSLLSRIHRVVGSHIDSIETKSQILFNKITKTPEIEEPWLFYKSSKPVDLNKITDSSLKIEYYSVDKSTWIQLYKVPNKYELELAKGPCYYIDKGEILFHNLERTYSLYSGVSTSNFEYLYTFNANRLKDKEIYVTLPSYQRLRYNRWTKLDPTYLYNNQGTYTSTYNQLWVSESLVPPTSGYSIRITSESSILYSSAKPFKINNSWDNIGLSLDLKRLNLEDNLNYSQRIEYRSKFTSQSERNKVNLFIANELNTLYFYSWAGTGNVDLSINYSDVDNVCLLDYPKIEYAREVLVPVSGDTSLFSSKYKDWEDGYIIYSAGKPYLGSSSFSNGILYTTRHLALPVEVEHVSYNYNVVSDILQTTYNLPPDSYIAAIVTGLAISTLLEIKDTRLFSNNRPTALLYDINRELENKNVATYSRSYWGNPSSRFYKEEEPAPAVTRISFNFED